MLTLVEVPPSTNELYRRSKVIAGEIVSLVRGDLPAIPLSHASSLPALHPHCVIFITKGIFKCSSNSRFVRFYSAGDIVLTGQADSSLDICAEMATEVIAVGIDDFCQRMQENPRLLIHWFSYQQADAAIMCALSAAYAGDDFKPVIDFVEYQAGDAIIREGDSPDCLYEMINGCASVSVKETPVGSVNRGEIFGEVSFLTASPRTASVTAISHCTVQAIKGDDFDNIVKLRPTLVSAMARTMAKRLSEVNNRLVRDTTLT